jgi:hypothetical protein
LKTATWSSTYTGYVVTTHDYAVRSALLLKPSNACSANAGVDVAPPQINMPPTAWPFPAGAARRYLDRCDRCDRCDQRSDWRDQVTVRALCSSQ